MISPIKAIRLKCLDCMGEQPSEVKACPCLKCALWKFRMGINPNTARNKDNIWLNKDIFKGLENAPAHKVISSIEAKNTALRRSLSVENEKDRV